MKKLVKIDRVRTINEARLFQKLGANVIGVTMYKNPTFLDNRVLDIITAVKIRKVLKTSKLAVEINDYNNILEIVDKICPDYIQVARLELLSYKLVYSLKEKGIGVIYSGLEASYDDDPSWILSRYKDAEEANIASYFQVDLLADVDNSWNFFKLETPKYPNELQIEDIVDIAQSHPLLISMNFDQENIMEIVNSFPTVKGIYFTLSDRTSREDIHRFTTHSIINCLHRING